ncbi:hypothetical protein ABZP36_015837 [Zizania latifolia]
MHGAPHEDGVLLELSRKGNLISGPCLLHLDGGQWLKKSLSSQAVSCWESPIPSIIHLQEASMANSTAIRMYTLLKALTICFMLAVVAGQNQQCSPSSCGDLHNISYPFRLQGDSRDCGVGPRPWYDLSCSSGKATIQINTGKYYVTSLNYTDESFWVVDANLHDTNSSCPLPRSDQRPYTEWDFPIDSYGFLDYRTADDSKWAYFVNCSRAVTDFKWYKPVNCLTGDNLFAFISPMYGAMGDLPLSCRYMAMIPFDARYFKEQISGASILNRTRALSWSEIHFIANCLAEDASTKKLIFAYTIVSAIDTTKLHFGALFCSPPALPHHPPPPNPALPPLTTALLSVTSALAPALPSANPKCHNTKVDAGDEEVDGEQMLQCLGGRWRALASWRRAGRPHPAMPSLKPPLLTWAASPSASSRSLSSIAPTSPTATSSSTPPATTTLSSPRGRRNPSPRSRRRWEPAVPAGAAPPPHSPVAVARVQSSTKARMDHCYGLTVLDFLVAHGTERVIDDIREHSYQISSLADFQYIDSCGRDQGSNVRPKSQSLVSLVNDKERIQEVRQKALATRDKQCSCCAMVNLQSSLPVPSSFARDSPSSPSPIGGDSVGAAVV